LFEDRVSLRDCDWPALRAAQEYVRPGDTFVVHSFEKIARNTNQLLRIVRHLTGQQVSVECHKQGLVSCGSARTEQPQWNRCWRSPISNAVACSNCRMRDWRRAAAKRTGVYKGKRKSLTSEQVAELRQQLAAGVFRSDLARSYGITTRTLYQYLKSA
jgi:DNA invertase Pin-like site-specific DNA recombinase